MVKISDVLSVTIRLLFTPAEWENVPAALKQFFEAHGNVLPAVSSTQNGPMPKGERFLRSTDMFGLRRFFADLCVVGFHTYSAKCETEEDGSARLRFMLCRAREVVWDGRPLEAAHAACHMACEMAAGGFEVEGWKNPYKGNERPAGCSLVVNGRYPIWSAEPIHQLVINDNGEVAVVEAA